jgi:tetratricopeptide (TPR) repeat protein
MATPLSLRGDHARAAAAGEGAITIADSLKDFRLRVEAMFYLAITYGGLGDYPRAVRLLRDAVAMLVGEWRYWGTPAISSVSNRTWLGRYLALQGNFPEAIELCEEAVQIADEARHPYSQVVAHLFAGGIYLSRGDIPRALPRLGTSRQLAADWNLHGFRLGAGAGLALAYALAGRMDEAVALAGEVAEQIKTRTGLLGFVSFDICRLGETYLEAGRLADAASVAERALTLARGSKERGHEALALHLLGDVAAQREPPELEAAAGYYRQAMALAEGLSMRPLVAHGHRGLSRLLRRTGDWAKAEEHLETATTMYREMGMSFWLEKAGEELGPPQRNSS